METSVNNKCKAFTSLEQSHKLAEILPLESADMYYEITAEEPEWKVYFGKSLSIAMNLISYRNGHVIPAWSLAALLDVLNDYILQTTIDGAVFVVCDREKAMVSDTYDNPVDACYELILKLNELNLL